MFMCTVNCSGFVKSHCFLVFHFQCHELNRYCLCLCYSHLGGRTIEDMQSSFPREIYETFFFNFFDRSENKPFKGGPQPDLVGSALQKILKSRSYKYLSESFFIGYFLRKINLVQLGMIFSTKHILFLNSGKHLDEASASSCLLLVAALQSCDYTGL